MLSEGYSIIMEEVDPRYSLQCNCNLHCYLSYNPLKLPIPDCTGPPRSPG